MIVTKQRPAMLCQNCLRLERLVTEARAAIPSSQHSGAIGYAAACDRADRAEHTRDALVAALRAIVKITDGSQPKDYPGALMVAQSALKAIDHDL